MEVDESLASDHRLVQQASTDRRWPDDLVAFYGSCDGTERTPAGYLFPGYCPDPLSDVGRHWTRWQTSWAGVVIALEDDETDQEERRDSLQIPTRRCPLRRGPVRRRPVRRHPIRPAARLNDRGQLQQLVERAVQR